jgi:sensor histidine kinase regulating citrate/malate metabolism
VAAARVFAIVALGSAYLSAKVKELGAGTEAELAHVRLQAADILHNIRSGIVTIDESGRLLFANPMAEQLLAIDLEKTKGRKSSPTPVDRSRAGESLERAVTRRVRTTRGEGMIAVAASGCRSA